MIATRPCSQSAASCSGTSVKSASVQAVSQDESRRPSSAARPRSHQVAIHRPYWLTWASASRTSWRRPPALAICAAKDAPGGRRSSHSPFSRRDRSRSATRALATVARRDGARDGLADEPLCLGHERCSFRLDERAPQRCERQPCFPVVRADHGQPAATPFDQEHECVRSHSDDGRPGRAQHRLDLSERRVDGIDVESQPSGSAFQRRVRIRRAGFSVERPRARAVREAGRASQELQPFGQAPGGPADGSDVHHSPTCGFRGVSRCRIGDAGLLASCLVAVAVSIRPSSSRTVRQDGSAHSRSRRAVSASRIDR